jgi:hypothetical protein
MSLIRCKASSLLTCHLLDLVRCLPQGQVSSLLLNQNNSLLLDQVKCHLLEVIPANSSTTREMEISEDHLILLTLELPGTISMILTLLRLVAKKPSAL